MVTSSNPVTDPDDFHPVGQRRLFSGWVRGNDFAVGEAVDATGTSVPVLVPSGHGEIYNLDIAAPDLLQSFADLGDGVIREGRIRPDRLTNTQIARVVLFATKYGLPWGPQWAQSRTPG